MQTSSFYLELTAVLMIILFPISVKDDDVVKVTHPLDQPSCHIFPV